MPLSAKRAWLRRLRVPQPRPKMHHMRKGLTPEQLGDLLELPLLAVLATYRRDGTVATLGEVAYTCTRCEEFSAHSVPATWTPPGWYLG